MQNWENAVLDWLIKCFLYFVPIILTFARYRSFPSSYKKTLPDIIADGQFCAVPFCLDVDVIITYFKKWQGTDQSIRTRGIVIFMCLLAIAIILILLYWDISFSDIQQKNEPVVSKDKKTLLKFILLISLAVIGFSFYVDVMF